MSLKPERERSYSFTTTASFGYRPWAGAEVYLDLEGAQGIPLSGLTGLGGFTNGELAKTSGARLKLYRARAFCARPGTMAVSKKPWSPMQGSWPAWRTSAEPC